MEPIIKLPRKKSYGVEPEFVEELGRFTYHIVDINNPNHAISESYDLQNEYDIALERWLENAE